MKKVLKPLGQELCESQLNDELMRCAILNMFGRSKEPFHLEGSLLVPTLHTDSKN